MVAVALTLVTGLDYVLSAVRNTTLPEPEPETA
jgi:hypothetical protein